MEYFEKETVIKPMRNYHLVTLLGTMGRLLSKVRQPLIAKWCRRKDHAVQGLRVDLHQHDLTQKLDRQRRKREQQDDVHEVRQDILVRGIFQSPLHRKETLLALSLVPRTATVPIFKIAHGNSPDCTRKGEGIANPFAAYHGKWMTWESTDKLEKKAIVHGTMEKSRGFLEEYKPVHRVL
jgi:hypothetical protein